MRWRGVLMILYRSSPEHFQFPRLHALISALTASALPQRAAHTAFFCLFSKIQLDLPLEATGGYIYISNYLTGTLEYTCTYLHIELIRRVIYVVLPTSK